MKQHSRTPSSTP